MPKKLDRPAASPAAVAQAPELPYKELALALAAALVLAAFLQSLTFPFIAWHSRHSLVQNPNLSGGLTPGNFAWAWTSLAGGEWNPLTRLSHQLDFTLYGANASGHHATNLALHLAAAALSFLAFERMTRAWMPSLLAAAVFAVHPLRSEAVAWVAAREDCLSGAFAALALYAYSRYAEAEAGRQWYAATLALFAAAVLSKTGAGALAFALPLLDMWPLGRRQPARQLVLEKLPLFAISLTAAAVAGYARRIDQDPEAIPAGALDQALNIVSAYALHLRDTLWPTGLSPAYPLDHDAWIVPALVMAALLLAITAYAWNRRSSAPWLGAGWGWYVILMMPTAGVVHYGLQSRADRYTYLPHAGLFLALAWAAHRRWGARILKPGFALLLALAALAYHNTSYWKDAETLFARAVEVTGDATPLVVNLGVIQAAQDRVAQAESTLQRAVKARPFDPRAHAALARVLLQQRRPEDAMREADEAARLQPSFADHHRLRAAALAELGRQDETLKAMEAAIQRASSARAGSEHRTIRGEYLLAFKRPQEAEADFREALRLASDNPIARRSLATSLLLQKRYQDAAAAYSAFLKEFPGDEAAQKGLQAATKELAGK